MNRKYFYFGIGIITIGFSLALMYVPLVYLYIGVLCIIAGIGCSEHK
jgi:hypothetical protein